jgi:hypothetical protein
MQKKFCNTFRVIWSYIYSFKFVQKNMTLILFWMFVKIFWTFSLFMKWSLQRTQYDSDLSTCICSYCQGRSSCITFVGGGGLCILVSWSIERRKLWRLNRSNKGICMFGQNSARPPLFVRLTPLTPMPVGILLDRNFCCRRPHEWRKHRALWLLLHGPMCGLAIGVAARYACGFAAHVQNWRHWPVLNVCDESLRVEHTACVHSGHCYGSCQSCVSPVSRPPWRVPPGVTESYYSAIAAVAQPHGDW